MIIYKNPGKNQDNDSYIANPTNEDDPFNQRWYYIYFPGWFYSFMRKNNFIDITLRKEYHSLLIKQLNEEL